ARMVCGLFFFFQAEDGIRDFHVTGVQTCALPISFVYKTYYGYAMAVVLRYVQAEMEAEEIVNESFVKVFRKLNAFEMHAEDGVLEKTFKSWLARIAVNTSIDVLRAKKPTDMLEDTSEADLRSEERRVGKE